MRELERGRVELSRGKQLVEALLQVEMDVLQEHMLSCAEFVCVLMVCWLRQCTLSDYCTGDAGRQRRVLMS